MSKTTKVDNSIINAVIHNASSASDSTVAWAISRKNKNGSFLSAWDSSVPLDICRYELRAGTTVGILGRTNEGKTLSHSSLWPKWIDQIDKRNETGEHNGRLVIVSVEESLEETWVKLLNYMGLNVPLANIDGGKIIDIDGFSARISAFSALPVVIIGPTLVPDYNNLPEGAYLAAKMPIRIINNMIVEAFKRMDSVNGIMPTADIICCGNIQNMTAYSDKVQDDFGIVAAELRGLARKLNCVVTVEIQAKAASVNHPKDPVPAALDTEWSAQIAQSMETIFSVCKVSNWSMVDIGDNYWDVEVTPSTFVIAMTKQRLSGDLSHRKFHATVKDGRFHIVKEMKRPPKRKRNEPSF